MASGADFKSYLAEAKKHVRGTAAVRLEKAAILLKNATREELSKKDNLSRQNASEPTCFDSA